MADKDIQESKFRYAILTKELYELKGEEVAMKSSVTLGFPFPDDPVYSTETIDLASKSATQTDGLAGRDVVLLHSERCSVNLEGLGDAAMQLADGPYKFRLIG